MKSADRKRNAPPTIERRSLIRLRPMPNKPRATPSPPPVEKRQEDSKRLLTSLGRKQAELTGRRLGGLVRGISEEFGPCRVRVIRVSDLARAKETADIIYESMDLGSSFGGEEVVGRAEPDPLLNEGR